MTQYTYDKYCSVLLCLWLDDVLTTEEHDKIVERLKWNMCYDDDAPQDGIWFCPVCGYARFVDDTFPQNFCPNCGCRMKEGE